LNPGDRERDWISITSQSYSSAATCLLRLIDCCYRKIWAGFALLFYGAILILVYAHHNWLGNFDSPPLSWRVGYGLALALFSGAMATTRPHLQLCRKGKTRA
jgi:hypothetical protein